MKRLTETCTGQHYSQLSKVEASGKTMPDYFELSLEETVETPSGSYLQKYRNQKDSYDVFYREGRFSPLEEISTGMQERDADQVMLAGENQGIQHLLDRDNNV